MPGDLEVPLELGLLLGHDGLAEVGLLDVDDLVAVALQDRTCLSVAAILQKKIFLK